LPAGACSGRDPLTGLYIAIGGAGPAPARPAQARAAAVRVSVSTSGQRAELSVNPASLGLPDPAGAGIRPCCDISSPARETGATEFDKSIDNASVIYLWSPS